MIVERERACDESVVAYGNEAGVYADGILKVCRFYAIPPHARRRHVRAPTCKDRLDGHHGCPGAGRNSNKPQKTLIAACAAIAIALPLLTGWSGAVPGTEIYRSGAPFAGGDVTQASLRRSIAQFRTGNLRAFEGLDDAGLRREDTTSRAACESHFLAVLQVLEKSYGKFAPLYPQRAKNDRDQLPISLTWKNAMGTSRYQEATVYMKVETAHVWDAHRLFDGRTIDAAAEWSAASEGARSVCLTEIVLKA